MELIFKIIWFLLPAGAANIAPVLVQKINFLNYPIDGGKLFLGEPVLGKNKTWRGLFFGILAAIIIVNLQDYTNFFDLNSFYNNFILGFLFGFGSLFGDIVKSFFKRRFKISSGTMWVPFDQVDWVLGALVFSSFIFSLGWKFWLVSILIGGVLHPIINMLGYLLKIKKNKF